MKVVRKYKRTWEKIECIIIRFVLFKRDMFYESKLFKMVKNLRMVKYIKIKSK